MVTQNNVICIKLFSFLSRVRLVYCIDQLLNNWIVLNSKLNSLVYRTLHCVWKKFPTFKLSVTLSNLIRFFQNVCTARKHKKFATKLIWHYPPHLRHVATLPWEIKNSNFLQICNNKTDFQSNADHPWKRLVWPLCSYHLDLDLDSITLIYLNST